MCQTQRSADIRAVHHDLAEHCHHRSGRVVRGCRSSSETTNQLIGTGGRVLLGVAVREDVELKTRHRQIFEKVGRCLFRGGDDVSSELLNGPATTPRLSSPLFGQKTSPGVDHLNTLDVDMFPDFIGFHDRFRVYSIRVTTFANLATWWRTVNVTPGGDTDLVTRLDPHSPATLTQAYTFALDP